MLYSNRRTFAVLLILVFSSIAVTQQQRHLEQYRELPRDGGTSALHSHRVLGTTSPESTSDSSTPKSIQEFVEKILMKDNFCDNRED